MHDLNKLRREIRAHRRSISPQEQSSHSRMLATRLVRSPLLLRSRRIALYLSVDGEVDPNPIIERVLSMGKQCYLPVLRKHPQRSLWFCHYRPGDKLLPNRFGIYEPSIRSRPPIPPWGLDLILLPLVAFDPQCNRLGMGGGYYDRTLAYLNRRSHWHSPRLIGLAHELQKVETIPAQSWDVPLQGVVTEQHFYRN
ncbi:5-formyltetrahydrofolate cyclo-ligase [hydrothermal vent metagenome]|uniref:5-formyltetrahydrofolate cyclo-ligase n=1 Tax=hydrothermal vent metagenome TaxID=652676 RepID=A0A3B1B026_9ZZZZ